VSFSITLLLKLIPDLEGDIFLKVPLERLPQENSRRHIRIKPQ
jgi:hypothetical protein